jgi:type IV pilus assembly protein PilB
MLQKVLDVPSKVETAVIARFKVMARMNIAENRRPQDGTFSISYKNCSYDFRINTLPVSGKEKVCIRILAPAVSLSSADKEIKLVGAEPEDIVKVKEMVSCPNGIILTSGPTGSGKTTTLYSVLKSLNDESVNITTIEDPIEIKLEGINQSQINAKAGITFASCMRAILRQDPDIILVGEIRDYETLEIAISAALTGHLVLSTVHTNSAAATVTRLIEMGAKDYLVSSTLSGVIAQRLVRKLCDDCKEEYYPTREEALKITKNPQEVEQLMKTPIYRAVGCTKCGFQGFKGRLGVYEIMMITKEIKKLIAQGAHDLEIEDCAIANGMTTLHKSCYKHVVDGLTTIDEFVRVLGLAGE